MKILYAAIDQTVPGTIGGSVHVTAVAEGLAALGHEVHVLATRGPSPFPASAGVHWTPLSPPLGSKTLRWARRGAVTRIARAIRPDVVIERYYNFGGEGIAAGRAVGATTVLEVNAPVIDFPGSKKALLDKVLLFEPMRRWREALCASADLIVTPAAAILPSGYAAVEDRRSRVGCGYRPIPSRSSRSGAVRPSASARLAVFAGAFRSWHGAIHLVRAMAALEQRGRSDIGAVLIGDGPERPRSRRLRKASAESSCIGAIPHEAMPAALAAADIGVAPFDIAAHRPLSLGFFWSPLKIFEYMAAGLPVVAPAVDRIPQLSLTSARVSSTSRRASRRLAAALERLSDVVTQTAARCRGTGARRARLQLVRPLPHAGVGDPRGVRLESRRPGARS